MSEISDSRVLTAFYERDFDRHGVRVTIEDVADYLRCDPEIVRRAMLRGRRQRLVRDRQRAGRRVWEPWKGQRA